MSELNQLSFAHENFVNDAEASSAEALQETVFSEPHFQSYIDLESDSSGIFGTMDIETATQIMQSSQ